jgi:hypothetical protein
MLYPNHKIENIFKLVHKTQDPKDIQWVIDNLDKFNYCEHNRYYYEDETHLNSIQCSFHNLISLLILHGNITKKQKEFVILFRKATYAVEEYIYDLNIERIRKEYLRVDRTLKERTPNKLSLPSGFSIISC